MRRPTGSRTAFLSAAAGLVAALASGCGGEADVSAQPDDTAGPGSGAAALECVPDDDGLDLPDDFCVTVVADDVGPARHLAVAPNGDLFVALRAASGETAARATGSSPSGTPTATGRPTSGSGGGTPGAPASPSTTGTSTSPRTTPSSAIPWRRAR